MNEEKILKSNNEIIQVKGKGSIKRIRKTSPIIRIIFDQIAK